MQQQVTKDIAEIKGVIRRRKKAFTLAFVLIFLAGSVTAFVLPPIYRSEATVLIEGQQIPEDFIKSTITGFVEERLQVITQQIMSRSKLTEIIERFNLYPQERRKYPLEQVLDKMRDDIELETINAEVKNPRTGRASTATIAFNISYDGKSPPTVQRVANELASLYLEENLKAREQRASATTAFFQEELKNLKTEIATLEKRISDFKKAHIGELPEYNEINLQTLSRLERERDKIEMQLRSLREREIYLKGQLASVDPFLPVGAEKGEVETDPATRLRFLKVKLTSLRAAYGEKHPDVIKVKNEVEELERQVGSGAGLEAQRRRLTELQDELATVGAKAGDKHPDVVRLKKEIKLLKQEITNTEDAAETGNASAGAKEPVEARPNNPAYINLKTQIASSRMEIQALLQETSKIKQKMESYQRKLESAPMVEKEYVRLQRDYQSAKQSYSEITSKLNEARVAQEMEETQRGERFTIVDPPQLPQNPFKPNRLAILLIGFVLALGAGVGLAAVREAADQSIKSAEDLARVSKAQVLSMMPLVVTQKERRRKITRRVFICVLLLAAIGAAVVWVHFYVMPLEVVWAKVGQRRSLLGFTAGKSLIGG